MFFSQDILSRKGGKLGVIWIAANFEPGSGMALTRREYCSVDITTACDEIVNPKTPFTLRLSSGLLVGVARVHRQQTHYVYMDLKQIWQRIKNMSILTLPIDLPPENKTTSHTLPDCCSFSCLDNPADLSFSVLPLGSESDFFSLSFDNMLLPAVPSTPEMRPGSVSSSPFTADPRDITISEEDGTPLESLQIQVPGEKDGFGDEGDGGMEVPLGPVTLLDGVTMPVLNISIDEWSDVGGPSDCSGYVNGDTSTDGVLLYNTEAGDFRVYESEVMPQTPVRPQTIDDAAQSPLNISFETAFLNLAPGTTEEGVPRRKYNRTKRKLIDAEIKMSSTAVKENMDTPQSTLRNFTKISARRSAKDLLSQPTWNFMTTQPHFYALWKRCAVIERQTAEGSELEDPFATAASQGGVRGGSQNVSSYVTTPIFEATRGHHSGMSDIEISANMELGREGSRDTRDGSISDYNSRFHVSDASGVNSTRNSHLSFETSSAQRKYDRTNKVIPPAMGGLSPIADIEQDIMDNVNLPGDVGFPDLEASYGSPNITHASNTPPSSPFIDSEPVTYFRHITGVMGVREEIEFRDLLPAGSTRKTAGRAFSHVLALITSKALSVKQEEPYSPIMLRRGESF